MAQKESVIYKICYKTISVQL